MLTTSANRSRADSLKLLQATLSRVDKGVTAGSSSSGSAGGAEAESGDISPAAAATAGDSQAASAAASALTAPVPSGAQLPALRWSFCIAWAVL